MQPELLNSIYRHWMWADQQKRLFDDLVGDDSQEPAHTGIVGMEMFLSKSATCLFLWYSMLYVVCQGIEEEGGVEVAGIAESYLKTRELLRMTRDATHRVQSHFWSSRLLNPLADDAIRDAVAAVHEAIGTWIKGQVAVTPMPESMLLSPEYLYRYIGNLDYAREVIQNNDLYMSSAAEFNDPFDLNIKPIVDIGDKRFEQYAIKLYSSKIDVQAKTTPERFAEFLNKREYASEEGRAGLVQGAMTGILSHGVCCFTERATCMKTWAIYGRDYSGICLKFRPDYSKTPFKQAAAVEYGAIFPRVGIDEEEKFGKLFLYKHSDWQEEQEWRIVLAGMSKQKTRFQPVELAAVVCGFNMRPRDVDKIRSWIVLNEAAAWYRPKLYLSRRREADFGMELVETNVY